MWNNENAYISDQKCLIWVFLDKNWKKKLLSYVKSEPSNLSICKILRKNNNTQIWDQKCLIYVFLVWNLEIILSYLKSATSNFSNCKILRKKMPKFGTENALFGCFCAEFSKNYCYIWNEYLRIYLIAKFCEEAKTIECGTKNALLRYFDKKCFIWVFLFKTF